MVTAFVPLAVKHLSSARYHELGRRLADACGGRLQVIQHGVDECWLSRWFKIHPFGVQTDWFKPAQPTPADRYETPGDFVRSNIVQHNRTTWAMECLNAHADADIIVWMDYGVLKQGGFTGKPVQEHHIADFIERLENSTFDDIPFPGIWQPGDISDHGDNWRFVGSTHIWPRKWLPLIHAAYRVECAHFIRRVGAVPNDLPIWAHVERKYGFPWRFYQANHDATQFTGFTG